MQVSLNFLTDQEIYQNITQGLLRKRLALNMLQKHLAAKAGISVPTLVKFEAGEEVKVLTLFKVMRALGESSRLNALILEDLESPKDLFESDQSGSERGIRKRRQRATRK